MDEGEKMNGAARDKKRDHVSHGSMSRTVSLASESFGSELRHRYHSLILTIIYT